MANTKAQYIGDGATSTFSITFPYLERAHVVVKENGQQLLSNQYTFLTDSSIQILPAPGVGAVIDIFRQTEIDTRLVNFQNGAILTEQEMDLDSEQAFYLIQENNENYAQLIDDALVALATANGLVVTDPSLVLDQLIQTMIDSAAAATLAQRIQDIDDNAEAILDNAQAVVNEFGGRVAADNSLQGQINALAGAVVAEVYVQPEKPVPGVGGVPDPIPDNARWYDDNDNNHPYIWQPFGLVNATYRWTATGNTGEYYVELAAGGNPALPSPDQVQVNDTSYLTKGTQPLAVSEWDYADPATLGYSTIIVRLADDTDPDTKTADYVESYRWLDLADPQIGVNAADITALDVRLTTAEGDVVTNASAISVLDTTVTNNGNAITANAADITALETTVNDGVNGVAANASGLSALTTRVTTAEGDIVVNASDVTALTGRVTTAEGDIVADGIAISALDVRVTSAEGTITSQSADITALQSTVNNGTTGVAANAAGLSALTTRVTTAEGDITTQASQITSLESDVDLRGTIFRQAAAPTANNTGDLWFDSDDGDKLYRWSGTAWVNVQDAAIGGNASAITALDTRVTTSEGDITATASDVTALTSRVTTAEGDIASAEVTILAHTSAISTAEGDIVALEARYGVSLNVNGYVSGFSLNNSGVVSDFVILADKFAIVDPAGGPGETEFVPFSVSGGIVSMQNVVISGSLLVNGTVTAGAIATLGGGLADIDNNLGAITTGTITLDATSHIKGGQTAYNTGTGFFLGYETADYKFSIGDGGTANFMTWDGTSLVVRGNISIGSYTASNNLLLAANTERSFTDGAGSWSEQKRFEINRPGSIRVTFDMRMGSTTGGVVDPAQARVLVDGVVKFTASSSSQTYGAKSTDITLTDSAQFVTIELREGTRDPIEPLETECYIRNAQVKADKSDGESVITD